MKCICDGVNIGDETSAIASIVGALCGTFRGSRSFPEDYLDFLMNRMDLIWNCRQEQCYQYARIYHRVSTADTWTEKISAASV